MKENYKEFRYLTKEDYDEQIKINDDNLKVYSKKQFNDLRSEKEQEIFGETWERKKRDKEKDIGDIELNKKRLYVSEYKKHSRLFKKEAAFFELQGGGFLTLLRARLLPFILLFILILGGIACSLAMCQNEEPTPTEETQETQETQGTTEEELDIKPITPTVLTISGVVSKDGQPVENASLSLQSGNDEVTTALTDKNGKYLMNDVQNGNYNLVCTVGDSVLTKSAEVWGESIVVNFVFPADDLHDVEDITDHHDEEDLPDSEPTEDTSDVKAIVKVNENTPSISVGGLETEAMLHMIVGKEVDITLLATLLEEETVPAEEKQAIQELCGELEMTYYDFSVLKEVFENQQLESSEYLKNTKTVLEIIIPFDSSHSVATYAFRYHDGQAEKMENLEEKPDTDFRDGTYYVTSNFVYIYTDSFSTYAIGAANTGEVIRGSDTITYSNKATLDMTSGKISILYMHDADSSNDARVEIYLVGNDGNILIAKSDIVPVGYQIESVDLMDGIVEKIPSVGTYEGLMKIIYLNSEGAVSTNVDIPLNVAIVK